MEKQAFVLGLVLIAGCASVTPHYDARFGDAVRQAKTNMTINPEAGKNPDPVAGMDGKAAADAVVLYQKTFKAPPPAVNVINIGGGVGSSK
ncbi:MAG TPA: hypothetical protein VGU61_12085 [Noviherbaspirillum sp.]|jgi:uncharacterized protein YceK|uniref:hypothetical protein n=1 Tax=Noviherbaspirillum sp. TaxID=1926288 RepID=UPI002DDCD028|nr:hypothetical protein [Noviherbaspirillum sp.]HEV2610998.1 hypothetical protein [Noviherbaspirillum sp.]